MESPKGKRLEPKSRPSNTVPQSSADPVEGAPNEERTLSIVSLNPRISKSKDNKPSLTSGISWADSSHKNLSKRNKSEKGSKYTISSGVSTGQGDNIRNSPKGFRLNDPKAFRKHFTVSRDVVDSKPILYPDHVKNPEGGEWKKISSHYNVPYAERKSSFKLTTADVSKQDKEHYLGDSCVLHDPVTLTRRIENLQKTIADTQPAVKVSRSLKRFNIGTQFPSEAQFEREVTTSAFTADLSQSVPLLNKFSLTTPKMSTTALATNSTTTPFVTKPSPQNKPNKPSKHQIARNDSVGTARTLQSSRESGIPPYRQDSKFQKLMNVFRKKKEPSG